MACTPPRAQYTLIIQPSERSVRSAVLGNLRNLSRPQGTTCIGSSSLSSFGEGHFEGVESGDPCADTIIDLAHSLALTCTYNLKRRSGDAIKPLKGLMDFWTNTSCCHAVIPHARLTLGMGLESSRGASKTGWSIQPALA